MEEKRVTIEEFAGLARIHMDTARRYVREGKVKASKIGKRYLIKASEVERFLDTGTNEAERRNPVAKGQ